MIIPGDSTIHSFTTDLIDKCYRLGANGRIAENKKLRSWYLKGKDDGQDSILNRLLAHNRLQSSFLYSGETASFNVECGVTVDELLHMQSEVFADTLHMYWKDDDFDTVIKDAVEMQGVYGKSFVKVIASGKASQLYYCSPSNIGVYREDIPQLDRQDCIVHKYQITKHELQRKLELKKYPKDQINAIMAYLPKNFPNPEEQTAAQDFIISYQLSLPGDSVSPTGGIFDINSMGDRNYIPTVNNDLVTMYEIWVWDTKLNDFQIITATDYFVIHIEPNDRKDGTYYFIKQEHPFVDFCANRLADYFWGISEVGGQIGLQHWINERLGQIQKVFKLQMNPPMVGENLTNATDEWPNFFKPGGRYTTNSSDVKITQLQTPSAINAYAEISNITDFMNDMSQINDMLQGKGTSGVRAEGHAALLARISSATQKDKALLIEKSVEKIATLTAKLMYKSDDTIYIVKYKNQEIKFTLSEFVEDFKVKVNNHSTSPLFAYDIEQTMFALRKMGDISSLRLIEALNVPNKADILADLKTKTAPDALDMQTAMKNMQNIEKQEKDSVILSLAKGR